MVQGTAESHQFEPGQLGGFSVEGDCTSTPIASVHNLDEAIGKVGPACAKGVERLANGVALLHRKIARPAERLDHRRDGRPRIPVAPLKDPYEFAQDDMVDVARRIGTAVLADHSVGPLRLPRNVRDQKAQQDVGVEPDQPCVSATIAQDDATGCPRTL